MPVETHQGQTENKANGLSDYKLQSVLLPTQAGHLENLTPLGRKWLSLPGELKKVAEREVVTVWFEI